jgi:ubiquinone biosynthesis protein UbiJ
MYKPTPVPEPPNSRFLRDEFNRISVALGQVDGGDTGDLEQRVADLEAQVAQLEIDVGALDTRVTTLETDLAVLDARVVDIEAQQIIQDNNIAANAADIAVNKSAITALENRYPLTWNGVS